MILFDYKKFGKLSKIIIINISRMKEGGDNGKNAWNLGVFLLIKY